MTREWATVDVWEVQGGYWEGKASLGSTELEQGAQRSCGTSGLEKVKARERKPRLTRPKWAMIPTPGGGQTRYLQRSLPANASSISVKFSFLRNQIMIYLNSSCFVLGPWDVLHKEPGGLLIPELLGLILFSIFASKQALVGISRHQIALT